MFYKTGIDITNDRQMFEFLKGHFEYPTMNSWNRLYSIANNVKLYNLKLSGDWSVAYNLLDNGEYETINFMIQDWCRQHPNYEIYFNGHSGGYLVLYNKFSGNGNILPESIVESDDYDEYKEYCQYYFGSVRANRSELVSYTKLVRDFDRLCDELRDYCDELSNLKFEVVEMERSVEQFNDSYANDLEMLDFKPLECDEEGVVDLHEVLMLQSLTEAFMRIASRESNGYILKFDGTKIKLTEKN